MTTTTPADQVVREAGITAHALEAVATHIRYRHVAAPRAIHFNDDHLRINVPGTADLAEHWAASLSDGDGIRCTRVDADNEYSHYETRGTLPDTGVRVHITWVRRSDVERAELVLLTNPHHDAREAARLILERHAAAEKARWDNNYAPEERGEWR